MHRRAAYQDFKEDLEWNDGANTSMNMNMRAKNHTKKDQDMPFSSLVSLDFLLLENLEHIVKEVTDAVLYSRNFDALDWRQSSIDGNDSIVRFLRDMFAFLEPSCVYHLIMVYFSR